MSTIFKLSAHGVPINPTHMIYKKIKLIFDIDNIDLEVILCQRFLGQSWTGGWLSRGSWQIVALDDYWWLFSKDFFEIYNVPLHISKFDDFRSNFVFLLKMLENQDEFLKSLFFDLQKCVIPQTNPQKNHHSILK